MKKKIIIIIFLIVLIGGFITYNFVLDYPTKLEIYINDEKITLSKNDENREIDLNFLTTTKDTNIKIKTFNKINVKVNDKKINNYVNYNIGKMDINENNKMEIKVMFENDKEYTTYYINTLPTTFAPYNVENNGDTYDGNYYMTTYTADAATSYVFSTDSDGKILFYKKCEGFCSQFRKETSSEGKIRYIYNAQDLSGGTELDMSNIYGKLIVLDENFKIIDEVKYIENEKSNNDKTYTIFEYIDDNHYLITSSNREKIDNIKGMKEVTLIQNNIQEIKDGKIVFEWRSAEHPELYNHIEDIKSLTQDGENDYIHINKVIIDPSDNNIIASFRNISTILKIDRTTGEIIWSLGGVEDDFNLSSKQKFAYQHSLSFTSDHSLMIYDNGDNRPALGIKNESRVIKINLDEKNKKVNSFNEYKLKNVYSMAMGNVQVIDEENDVFLVTYGTGIFSKGPVQLIDFKNDKILFSFNLETTKMMFSAQKSN